MTDQSPKNRLQEYCQKRKIPLPIYQIVCQRGPPHLPEFLAEVEVKGRTFSGDDFYSSKTEAHQSAARIACDAFITNYIDHRSIKHLPSEYSDIEQFIIELVKSTNGRIRKIRPADNHGIYRFEITGSYRYCENIHRHHSKNQIYFMVDPIKRSFYQKCYDPDCYNFQSTSKTIAKGQNITIPSMPTNIVDKCSFCQIQMVHNRKQECLKCKLKICSICATNCFICAKTVHCPACRKICEKTGKPS